MFPQAVIEPGEVAPMKFVGEDWKLTRSSSVVVDEVCVWVIVSYDCVEVDTVWATDWLAVDWVVVWDVV